MYSSPKFASQLWPLGSNFVRPRMRWLFAAILAISGCPKHPIEVSTDVSTRDMSIAIEVKNEGGPTRVIARADGRLPYTSYLTLGAGDRFVLRGEHESDPTTAFTQDPNDETKYIAETERKSGTFVVDLLRDADRAILDSEVSIPPPFDLTGPSGIVRRGDPIVLRWQGATGTHTTGVVVAGTCTTGLNLPLHADTGEYVINPGEIPRPNKGAADACDVTISVVRTAPWESKPFLYSVASQSRTLIVRLVP